eukprot:COSAG02_NODE_134_length_34593_cov_43.594886_4_plen_166_part_00
MSGANARVELRWNAQEDEAGGDEHPRSVSLIDPIALVEGRAHQVRGDAHVQQPFEYLQPRRAALVVVASHRPSPLLLLHRRIYPPCRMCTRTHAGTRIFCQLMSASVSLHPCDARALRRAAFARRRPRMTDDEACLPYPGTSEHPDVSPSQHFSSVPPFIEFRQL